MRKFVIAFFANTIFIGNLFACSDSLKMELIKFLMFEDKLITVTDTAYLYLVDFKDPNINSIDSNMNFNEIDNGIYKFGVFSPDTKSYMFIKDHGKIFIIKDYLSINVIEKVLFFFDNNEMKILEDERLKYLLSIIRFLSYR